VRRGSLLPVLILLLPVPVVAQRLPFTTYTAAHGLSHELVFDVLADSRGFVWFATPDGVSRFDGTRFVAYYRRDGLPDSAVNTILETHGGVIWASTNGGGVARFEPRGVQLADGRRVFFTAFTVGADRRTNRVNRLAEDERGDFWAATDGGLFHMASGQTRFAHVPLSALGVPDDVYVGDVVTCQSGELWLATGQGLVRRLADGRGALFAASPLPSRPFVRRVLASDGGLVWASTTAGVFVLARPAAGADVTPRWTMPRPCGMSADHVVQLPTAPGEGCHIGVAHGLANDRPTGIALGGDGRLLVGHQAGGLSEIVSGRVSVIEPANQEFDAHNLAVDRLGNLWVGTQAGARRLLRGGFVAYSTFEGLQQHSVKRLTLDPDRSLIAITSDYTMHWFHKGQLAWSRIVLPHEVARPSWGRQGDVRARNGQWWVPTGNGLYLYPAVPITTLGRARPVARFSTTDGLAGNDISALLEDSAGNLWIGHTSTGGPALTRRDGRTGRFTVVPIEDARQVTTVVNLIEDRAGHIWLSMRDGGVARFRDDRMRVVPGLPWLAGVNFFVDSRRRLWIGTTEGLAFVDDPTAEVVNITRYAPTDRLSAVVNAMTEDRAGRLFLSTLNGVVQFDRERGTMRRYTTADGLPSDLVTGGAVRDGRGDLWFGTARGLARLRPSELVVLPPGPPRIGAVVIGDRHVPVSEFGDVEVADLSVDSAQTRLRIDYFSMGGGGLPARFEYRLGPDEPWSRPSESRSVELARPAAGRYRFEVRALDPATSAVVPGTASVTFRVLPPLWLRWWFLTLGAAVIVGAAYGFHRYQLTHAVRLERVRARIATDLHDDIGSSLSQISILSEVSRQRIHNDPGTAHESLGLIAETSRELVDKMADIVWAVNPKRDSLSDLIYRMRRFADDTFGATDIGFRFSAPDSVQHLRLGADVRRELLLILKESVTNIAKHARATEASVDLTVDGPRLLLTIWDNGRGFDPEAAFDGNGVQSMRNRVKNLGGTLRIDSKPGVGTSVALEIRN